MVEKDVKCAVNKQRFCEAFISICVLNVKMCPATLFVMVLWHMAAHFT